MTVIDTRAQPDLRATAEKVAKSVVAANAQAVDTAGCFPQASFAALKEAGLLGAMIPASFGGGGAGLKEIADICAILGRHCASTAMIFAMHQIKVDSLLRCATESAWVRGYLTRIARDGLLLASATTEAEVGGSLRTSVCAIEPTGDGQFTVAKNASVISYGKNADAILLTARRNADAPASDQVMVVLERGQYNLEQTSTWDTLGMRGTCSDGFVLTARAPLEQILPKSFAELVSESMLPVAHLLWSSVWYGIAAEALARAQAFSRANAKKVGMEQDIAGLRVAETAAKLSLIRTAIQQGLEAQELARKLPDRGGDVGHAVAINLLKVNVAETAADVVMGALMVCGIKGYANHGPYSLGRHLRDVLSARLMINNDRILGNTAQLLRIARLDGHLSGQ